METQSVKICRQTVRTPGSRHSAFAPAAAPLQFLEIKEMNDLCGAYRARIRALVAACRKAPADAASRKTSFTRRQLADLWQAYRAAARDAREMNEAYLAQLSARIYRFSHPTEKKYRDAA